MKINVKTASSKTRKKVSKHASSVPAIFVALNNILSKNFKY